jgi:competence protein ComEA
MSTPPREWRFFGDAPAPETLEPEHPDEDLAGELAETPGGAKPAHADTGSRDGIRAHPMLLVGGAVASVVVLALVFVGVAFASFADRPGSVVIANRSDPSHAAAAPSGLVSGGTLGDPVVVDVEGAVVLPGLLHVPAGSRVGDAIVAAGGYSSAVDLDAASTQLNLAATVGDGDKVRVPSLAERIANVLRSPAADGGLAAAPGGLIDLNHADQAALESLPGIGPVTATKIITARSSQPFSSVDDAATRKVLSASVVEQIRPLVTVTP